MSLSLFYVANPSVMSGVRSTASIRYLRLYGSLPQTIQYADVGVDLPESSRADEAIKICRPPKQQKSPALPAAGLLPKSEL